MGGVLVCIHSTWMQTGSRKRGQTMVGRCSGKYIYFREIIFKIGVLYE